MRLRGISQCKHIKLLMCSDNHSLLVLANKLVTGRLKGESSNRLARGPFCAAEVLPGIPCWNGANEIGQ